MLSVSALILGFGGYKIEKRHLDSEVRVKTTEVNNLFAKLIEKEARMALESNKHLKEFVMGMGTYFFVDNDGETDFDFTHEPIEHLMNKWNEKLKIKY